MATIQHPPPAHPQIQYVNNVHDFFNTPFTRDVNAIGWRRTLPGNYAEIVDKIGMTDNLLSLEEGKLNQLELSHEGQIARDTILTDLQHLKAQGTDPTLNLIRHYERDEEYQVFPTDVYSYHIDRSTAPAATFLCTYFGEPSDLLPNAQATQKVLLPEIRSQLLRNYEGRPGDFDAYLREYFYDLHYHAEPGAQPISLGTGNFWRLAIDYPGTTVPPCIHRAPLESSGRTRLMVIS